MYWTPETERFTRMHSVFCYHFMKRSPTSNPKEMLPQLFFEPVGAPPRVALVCLNRF